LIGYLIDSLKHNRYINAFFGVKLLCILAMINALSHPKSRIWFYDSIHTGAATGSLNWILPHCAEVQPT